MSEDLRTAVAVLMLAVGVAMVCYAGYLQYASLPNEHTVRQWGKRTGIALAGLALITSGSILF
jgi:hypothetical protein